MPSSEVLRRPRSVTAAGTLRTVMSPIEMRSMVTGATRAMPFAVETAREITVAQQNSGALGILVAERHHGRAGIDHDVDGAAVHIGLGIEMPVAPRLDLDDRAEVAGFGAAAFACGGHAAISLAVGRPSIRCAPVFSVSKCENAAMTMTMATPQLAVSRKSCLVPEFKAIVECSSW